MSKVTVIITTYNLQSLIGTCFDELLAQSFKDFTILVIDDASTDKTCEIISEYERNYPELIQSIFLKENMGSPSLVRNLALDSGRINSEYLIFLDGDDKIEPNFLEVLYNLAYKKNADIAICAYNRVILETGQIRSIEMQGFPSQVSIPPYDDTPAFINSALWNKLIKTSLIDGCRAPAFRIGEDLCFFISLLQKNVKIVFTDNTLIHYQERQSSNISSVSPEIVYELADELYSYFCTSSNNDYKNLLSLVIFIHIGISMPLRVNNNPAASITSHLKWTRKFFSSKFKLFKNDKLLKLSSLSKRGIRGYAIWVSLVLYKLHMFGIFIALYNLYSKVFRKDIKF